MYRITFNLLLVFAVTQLSGFSSNRPELCTSAQWNSSAVTYLNSRALNSTILGIFIDSDDQFYALQSNRTALWTWSIENAYTDLANISVDQISRYSSLFVTEEKQVYFDTAQQPGRIIRRSLNGTNNVTVAEFGAECRGLFIDRNNTLYCSEMGDDRVEMKSLNDTSNATVATRAGTGASGASATELNNPWGIFVDTNFDLYVADAGNDRIQLFQSGSATGTTIVGPGTHGSNTLSQPTDVILDQDANLYIADNRHHRIVRVSPIGFQCIVGCSGTNGSAADQLCNAYSLRFDSYGNLFVVDEKNYRIQKFLLTSRCRVSYNRPQLCGNATWNSNAITFADNNTLQTEARGFFIDTDDTVYLARHQQADILRWVHGTANNSSHPDHIPSGPLFLFTHPFVTLEKDVYFEVASSAGQIEKRSVNGSTNVFVVQFNDQCHGLFVDVSNTLYCSVYQQHRVRSVSLNINGSAVITRAGNGSNGSAANQLSQPWGIFVDLSFDLYVADAGNRRIQRFMTNELNGTTVAGQGVPSGLTLAFPTSVIVDGSNCLYVADNNNHRVMRVTSTEYQCISGCSGVFGSASNEFSLVFSLRFDTDGNLYVADEYNNRIQKLTLTYNCEAVSFNRPPLCVNATWNKTGITFVDNHTLAVKPWSVFIDTEDTVYYADRTNRQILIWSQNNVTVLSNVSLSMYCPLFVTSNGDIYYAYGFRGGRVMRISLGESQPSHVAIFENECYGLFIDRYKTLYCSVNDENRVLTTSLGSNDQVTTICAGTGTSGPTADQLSSPGGIFVDIDLTLFVADTGNDRIQRFLPNQTNGSTVAGNNTPCGLQLNYPTDVVVDGSGFIFIADSRNHRVLRVGWGGYRCVAGCQSHPGSAANQLDRPSSMRLDSVGNVFVVDRNNRRIQTFLINGQCNQTIGANASMSCPMISTSTTVTGSVTSSMTTVVRFQPMSTTSQQIGSFSNVTSTPCSVLTPCQNNGSCFLVTINTRGYSCSCPNDFAGNHCQSNRRPCGTNPCLYNGTCESLTNGTTVCRCAPGREGSRCERRTDFCVNVRCENDGVCQSRPATYRCLCLTDRYSGVHCEIVSGKMRMYRISAFTIACASIAMIVGCATFVVMMDILKYVFGIDVAKVKETKVKETRRRKPRKYAVAIHHRYVN